MKTAGPYTPFIGQTPLKRQCPFTKELVHSDAIKVGDSDNR